MIKVLWHQRGATILILAASYFLFSQCVLSTYQPDLPLTPDNVLDAIWATEWHLLLWGNCLSLLLLSICLPVLAGCRSGWLGWMERGALMLLSLALCLLAFRAALLFIFPIPTFLFDLAQQGDPPGTALDLSWLRPLATGALIVGPLGLGLTRVVNTESPHLRLIGLGFILAGVLALFSLLWDETYMTFIFYELCACAPHIYLAGVLPSISPLVLILFLGLSGHAVLSAKAGIQAQSG